MWVANADGFVNQLYLKDDALNKVFIQHNFKVLKIP